MSEDATTMAYNIRGYTKTVNMTLRRIGTESSTTEKKTDSKSLLKTISKNSTGSTIFYYSIIDARNIDL